MHLHQNSTKIFKIAKYPLTGVPYRVIFTKKKCKKIFEIFFLIFSNFQLTERVLQRRFANVRSQKQAEQAVVDLLRAVPEMDLDRVLEMAQPKPL